MKLARVNFRKQMVNNGNTMLIEYLFPKFTIYFHSFTIVYQLKKVPLYLKQDV